MFIYMQTQITAVLLCSVRAAMLLLLLKTKPRQQLLAFSCVALPKVLEKHDSFVKEQIFHEETHFIYCRFVH